MKRRDFIRLIGGATAWPFGVRAQQIVKLPTIGFMDIATPSLYAPWVNAFVERLRAHDWIEGRTVSIEYRWAEGSYERVAEIAAEFVRMKVDVILTASYSVVGHQSVAQINAQARPAGAKRIAANIAKLPDGASKLITGPVPMSAFGGKAEPLN